MTELPSASQDFSLVSSRKLLALYAAMLACRRIAEQPRRLTANGATQRGGFIRGHEAAAVGAAIDLLGHDTVAPVPSPDPALKAINPAVSAVPSVSLAIRSAINGKNSGKITLLFSSARRSSESAWLRALNVAADRHLPVLFVSLNRPDHEEEQPEIEAVRQSRKSYALPSIRVDGSDVVAIYRVASEAIAHARKNHGPTLIDCRLVTPGDPIETMRRYLAGKGLDPAEFSP